VSSRFAGFVRVGPDLHVHARHRWLLGRREIRQTGRWHRSRSAHPPGSCRPHYSSPSAPRSQIPWILRSSGPPGREKGTGWDDPSSNRREWSYVTPVSACGSTAAVAGQLNGAMSGDALLGMLLPMWQLVIGCCVVLALAVATARLVRRGRSRMTNALLITGAAIVGLSVLGVLAASR